ncbi:MAG: hypothetical protein IKW98_13055 [Prevotella sp.]|nr:hypothetical protein [Prevotella sp.]
MVDENKVIGHFYTYDKPRFDNIKESLEEIEMSNGAKGALPNVVDIQTGYEDPRWIEKSNSIKARDNYTCQLCHVFNPMQGDYVFVKQGEYETIHHYYWAGNDKYMIFVKGYTLSITFDFMPGFHLAMPRLNVHHKIYYRNRDLWDYQDDCLVTLCEDCHHYVHSLKELCIPIAEVNADGQTIIIGRIHSKTYKPQLDHTDLGSFRPFSLVEEIIWEVGLNEQDSADFKRAMNENKQWFNHHAILDDKVVNISYFTQKNQPNSKYTDKETRIAAEFIIHDFIENIMGYSRYSSS